jgi:hypothetical protein
MSEHAIVQVYTLLGNIKSQLTINVLGAMGLPVRLSIFTSEEAVKNHFEENPTKHSSVLVLCDVSFGVRRFRSIQQGTRSASRLPHWTSYAGWIVLVNEKLLNKLIQGLANQIHGDYFRHFADRLKKGEMPWGPKKSLKTNSPNHKKRRHRSQRGSWM